MDTVSKLSRYAVRINSQIRFIGVPKTIDNDLIHTDHTPGFGSAAKYIATTVREITRDSSVYHTESVTIVEIMGRDAGWLTASSVLARQTKDSNPVLIYLPERDFDEEEFCGKIRAGLTRRRNLIVCVSEGIHDKDGKLICEHGDQVEKDIFGHPMMSGCGKYLENLIKHRFNIKVRSIELNVPQRCGASDLSETDIEESAAAGSFGVTAALAGETGQMVSFSCSRNPQYQMKLALEDVNRICNQTKNVPQSWISEDGTDITEEFTEYARPLILGEMPLQYQDGLPVFLVRKGNQ